MRSFLALYRGKSVGSSELVSVTADPKIVSRFACEILRSEGFKDDPVLEAVEDGRRRALQIVRDEPTK